MPNVIKCDTLWAGNVGIEGNKLLGIDASRHYSIDLNPADSTLRVGGVTD